MMKNNSLITKVNQHKSDFASEFTELMRPPSCRTVENLLMIEGPASELEKFATKARTPRSDLDFMVFVPMWKEMEAALATLMSIAKKSGLDFIDADGNLSKARDLFSEWPKQQWGATGFPSHVIVKEEKTRLTYIFDNDYAAPEPIVKKASKMFSKLEFVLSTIDKNTKSVVTHRYCCGVEKELHFKRLLTADEFRVASQFQNQSACLTWSI